MDNRIVGTDVSNVQWLPSYNDFVLLGMEVEASNNE